MSLNKTNGDDGVAKYHKKYENEEITMKPNKSDEAPGKNKNDGNDDSSNKSVKKPKMMKNGLKDRPFLSWIRILSVTALWWCFVIGFFCLCFYLMLLMIYGAGWYRMHPYFVRDFGKYPGILNQPSLNIKCWQSERMTPPNCDTNKLAVRVNKIFNFKPDPYAKDERPRELIDKLTNVRVTEEQLLENQVYVTCEGRKQKDKENLQGMKIHNGYTAGMNVDEFPWTKRTKRKSWPKVVLDLEGTKIAQGSDKDTVFIECRAWAKNIEREDRHVDKKTPRGGVLAVFCFNNGKIVKSEDCNE